jgi:hypothetical protein
MKVIVIAMTVLMSFSSSSQTTHTAKPRWEILEGRKFCVIEKQDLAFHTLKTSMDIVVRKVSTGQEQTYREVHSTGYSGHTFKLITENVLRLPKYLSRTVSQYGSNEVGFFNVKDLEWVYVKKFPLNYFDSTDGFSERCFE